MAVNTPAPAVSGEAPGRLAAPSVLAKATESAYPVTVFPAASWAVTATAEDAPDVTGPTTFTRNDAAAPGPTETGEDVPVRDAVVESVAATVSGPAVARVTVKVPLPFVSVAGDGSTEAVSELVTFTVPE